MHTRASSVRSTYGQAQVRLRGNPFNVSTHSHHRASLKAPKKSENYIQNNAEGSPNLLNNYGSSKPQLDNSSNHKVTSAASSLIQWQRNNFRPLHPELIEFEGDEDQNLIDEKNQQPKNGTVECKN